MQTDFLINFKNVIYSLTIASFIIIFLISVMSMYNSNSLIALIVSYGVIVSSLILMFGVLYNMSNISYTMFNKLITLFPLVYIILIILVLMFLLVSYFDEIVSNKVSNYYFSFSLLLNIFLVTQIIIFYSNIGFETSKYISNKVFSLLSLLGTISALLVITLSVILKSFSTDG
jgi:hypothetical protein